ISMPSNSRYEVLKKMFLPETPAVIVARGLVVPEEMLKAARECKIAILTSRAATSRLSGELSSYLDSRLAERTSVHGVLMDIYGMGVLIQGDSGIGKSETGLELVKR
ncbi:HPr kinase/phosphorylase, partial [Klebsiella pneumoniae]|nr:HPr kinase/phosphorylase [Klebsiella pneumoniae]